jgi:hypothetical protein
MLDTHRRRRPLRVLAYTLLAAGAGVLLIDPTRSLQGQSVLTRWVWSAFLLAGTLTAIYGAVRDRYLAEFIGLPLLMTSLAVFVVLLGAAHSTGSIAFAFFLASLIVVMHSRWLDLWRLVGASTRAERKRE